MSDDLHESLHPSTHPQRHEGRAASTYAGFVQAVVDRGLSRDLAECAIPAVLFHVERRLVREGADDLLAQLPSKLQDLLLPHRLEHGEKPEKYGARELQRRVAADLRIDDAGEVVRSVLAVTRARIGQGEAEDVAGQLPSDLRALWQGA